MNILLVYFDLNTGNYPSLNHGLAGLTGALKKHGHEVFFHHITTPDTMRIAQEAAVRTDSLIGISFVTNQKNYVKLFFDPLKNLKSLVVAGGLHPTLEKGKVLHEFGAFDGVCVGEGEVPMIDLVQKLMSGKDYLRTPGFIFRNGNEFIENPLPNLSQIDDLYLPDYSLFAVQDIVRQSGQSFPMMLGRGCPFSCAYCCNHTIRNRYPNKQEYVRFPSIQRAMEIIKSNLKSASSVKSIAFADDILTLDKKWLTEFCQAYRTEINMPFLCNARVETMNQDVVSALKLGGCKAVDFGVESGNEWLRIHVLNRHHSNKKIAEAFTLVSKNGMSTFSHNMIGLPFETSAMARDTVAFNKRLRPNFGRCTYFYPYPGTLLHQKCVTYNLIEEDSLAAVSGYLEKPVLKEIHLSRLEAERAAKNLKLYFYIRMVASKLKLPQALETCAEVIGNIFCNQVLYIIDSPRPNFFIAKVRLYLRTLSLKHFR